MSFCMYMIESNITKNRDGSNICNTNKFTKRRGKISIIKMFNPNLIKKKSNYLYFKHNNKTSMPF